MKKTLLLGALLLLAPFAANAKDSFKFAWSHYTGFEPVAYMEFSGILEKHAKKHGITISVELINDYINSVELFTAGSYDALTVTNMDALAFPSVGGVDTSFVVIGSFSNGNDAIVSKGASNVKGLKGKEVYLVELSVSHYLLARALEKNGLSEKNLTVTNTSDAQIGSLFTAKDSVNVVTWNPIVNAIAGDKGANVLFTSAQIPGEIIDGIVTRTDADPRLKKALVGAWYETMAVMSGSQGDEKQAEAIQFMAEKAGGTLADFKAQLETTEMFYDPNLSATFASGPAIKKTMEFVRTFAFDNGLYGEDAPDKNFIGIAFPDGTIQGEKGNVKLRFDATYMTLAAEGKL